eukprot:g74231.t1
MMMMMMMMLMLMSYIDACPHLREQEKMLQEHTPPSGATEASTGDETLTRVCARCPQPGVKDATLCHLHVVG